mmetsp:Transcript_8135/g.28613  ORF Transcript_8135/g.28613 Transcript_8135/m.28613 type:complete len:365 (-) Transcript_8135:177-1271(-)
MLDDDLVPGVAHRLLQPAHLGEERRGGLLLRSARRRVQRAHVLLWAAGPAPRRRDVDELRRVDELQADGQGDDVDALVVVVPEILARAFQVDKLSAAGWAHAVEAAAVLRPRAQLAPRLDLAGLDDDDARDDRLLEALIVLLVAAAAVLGERQDAVVVEAAVELGAVLGHLLRVGDLAIQGPVGVALVVVLEPIERRAGRRRDEQLRLMDAHGAHRADADLRHQLRRVLVEDERYVVEDLWDRRLEEQLRRKPKRRRADDLLDRAVTTFDGLLARSAAVRHAAEEPVLPRVRQVDALEVVREEALAHLRPHRQRELHEALERHDRGHAPQVYDAPPHKGLVGLVAHLLGELALKRLAQQVVVVV